jgi:nitrile hydratase subunit beta
VAPTPSRKGIPGLGYRPPVDGVHDLGGKQGFGPVVREEHEPPFHAEWEGRVHGMNVASDIGPAFRWSIERMGAVEYLTTSYYEHWLASMELNGVESGAFTQADLDDAAARVAAGAPAPTRFDPAAVEAARRRITPHPEPAFEAPAPRFAPGDRVTVARRSASGHSRCPAYLRGAPGVIESVHAPRPILDVYETEGGRVVPQAWYTIAFRSSDLWDDPGPSHVVHVDLWETHLEA